MKFEMEELVPIVGKLAQKYTSNESTSITYEMAEQLMEAVLYCINEAEQNVSNAMISNKEISALQMYEAGKRAVEEKVKKSIKIYNEILSVFDFYENRCLYDTVIVGLPEFFKRYDILSEPQNTILTLDYPVLKDISGYTGIDKIHQFLICIYIEQRFLAVFPREYVIGILAEYSSQYKEIIDNICEIVIKSVIEHTMAGKDLSHLKLDKKDYIYIQKCFNEKDLCDVQKKFEGMVNAIFWEVHGE